MSVGARTSVGLSALQVAMSARAAKMEPRGTRFRDKHGRAVGMCRVGGLAADLVGHDRLLALAAPALREAWPGALEDRLPLFVALPEPGRPDDDGRFGIDFVEALQAQSKAKVDVARSAVTRAGHAGFAWALEAALATLGRPDAPPAVMVGGVDSYYHPEVVRWLDEACRLHSLEAEEGFIPGEGAGFALLVRDPGALCALRPLAAIDRVLTGREETVVTGEPNIARAMTAMMHTLGGGSALRWVLTDLNGERHRAREWGLVALRGVLAEGAVEERFARAFGDVGAATGALLLAVACMFFRSGCAPASTGAVALHAEGPARGALRFEAIP